MTGRGQCRSFLAQRSRRRTGSARRRPVHPRPWGAQWPAGQLGGPPSAFSCPACRSRDPRGLGIGQAARNWTALCLVGLAPATSPRAASSSTRSQVPQHRVGSIAARPDGGTPSNDASWRVYRPGCEMLRNLSGAVSQGLGTHGEIRVGSPSDHDERAALPVSDPSDSASVRRGASPCGLCVGRVLAHAQSAAPWRGG